MGPTIAEAHGTIARPPVIIAQQLSKTFEQGDAVVYALRSIDLAIGEGEFVAIMGPSGSGKTTLLALLAGLERPTSGSVRVRGACVSEMADDTATVFRRRHIGIVYQHFNFLADLTIEENIGAPLMLDGCSHDEIDRRVARVLEQLNLLDRRHHLPETVSGGELQRAAIARALVIEPALLLADEPTGNLDSAAGERVLLDMRHACDELGRTIIMVTHNPLAAAYGDRTVHLLDGCLRDTSR